MTLEHDTDIIHAVLVEHAKRNASDNDPVSEYYPDVTRFGEEQTRLTTRTSIAPHLRTMPIGSVLYIGGKTDKPRTGTTGKIIGDEFYQMSITDSGLFVLTVDGVAELEDQESLHEGIERVLVDHNGKRIVITRPQEIEEWTFVYCDRWIGEGDAYYEVLDGRHHDAPGYHWIKDDAVIQADDGTVLHGPKPEQLASDYIKGLNRLHGIARADVPDNPLVILGVSHKLDIDATITRLARGRVTLDHYLQVTGGRTIDYSECAFLTLDPGSHRSTVEYRGKMLSHEPSNEG